MSRSVAAFHHGISRAVQVPAHRPLPFVVMRVRRQSAIDEFDAPAIEECAARPDGDEYRRATVLGDADACGARQPGLRAGTTHDRMAE